MGRSKMILEKKGRGKGKVLFHVAKLNETEDSWCS